MAWIPERRLERRLMGLAAAALLGVVPLMLFMSSLGPRRPLAGVAASLELRFVAEQQRPLPLPLSAPIPRALRERTRSSRTLAEAPAASRAQGLSEAEQHTVASQAPADAASGPALDLKVRAAMLQDARGVGSVTREDLARLRAIVPSSVLTQGIKESAVPECMSGDALKHGPDVGPYLRLNGLARLPLWVITAASGKCKVN